MCSFYFYCFCPNLQQRSISALQWCRSRGGWGDISPPIFQVGGMACTIIPPIFRGGISYYTNNICEVPTKIMQEIAGFECGNAKISLGSLCSFAFYRLSQCVWFAGSFGGVYSVLSLVGKLHRRNKLTDKHVILCIYSDMYSDAD